MKIFAIQCMNSDAYGYRAAFTTLDLVIEYAVNVLSMSNEEEEIVRNRAKAGHEIIHMHENFQLAIFDEREQFLYMRHRKRVNEARKALDEVCNDISVSRSMVLNSLIELIERARLVTAEIKEDMRSSM